MHIIIVHILYQTTTSTSTYCAFQRYMASPTAHILKLYRSWAVRRANPSDRLRRTASPLRNEIVVTSICLPRTLTAVSFAMPSTLCVETLQALVPALLSFDVTTPVRVCGLDCLLTLRLPASTPFSLSYAASLHLDKMHCHQRIFARTACIVAASILGESPTMLQLGGEILHLQRSKTSIGPSWTSTRLSIVTNKKRKSQHN